MEVDKTETDFCKNVKIKELITITINGCSAINRPIDAQLFTSDIDNDKTLVISNIDDMLRLMTQYSAEGVYSINGIDIHFSAEKMWIHSLDTKISILIKNN